MATPSVVAVTPDSSGVTLVTPTATLVAPPVRVTGIVIASLAPCTSSSGSPSLAPALGTPNVKPGTTGSTPRSGTTDTSSRAIPKPPAEFVDANSSTVVASWAVKLAVPRSQVMVGRV